jgi:hypothetical protein
VINSNLSYTNGNGDEESECRSSFGEMLRASGWREVLCEGEQMGCDGMWWWARVRAKFEINKVESDSIKLVLRTLRQCLRNLKMSDSTKIYILHAADICAPTTRNYTN